MLSRTADHLYWMARYTERAENTVRMLDVSYRMSLLPGANGGDTESWSAILDISELSEAFARTGRPLSACDVIEFVVLDRDNPSSVWNCLRAARENAHAVRGTLTAEMWETTNATWLEIREMTPQKLRATDLGEFFEWVKFRSHLLRGVTFGTMLHDEAFKFVRLGTFLERADNTARLLDVKYHSLLPRAEGLGSSTDFYQWGALLRSVSAFETYRHVYRDVITPHKVAELLILPPRVPRRHHAAQGRRAADPQRRHAALAACLSRRDQRHPRRDRQPALGRGRPAGRRAACHTALRAHGRYLRHRAACLAGALPGAHQPPR